MIAAQTQELFRRRADLLYWRHRQACLEADLVGLHAGVTDPGRRSDLLAAWHGVSGLVIEMERQLP